MKNEVDNPGDGDELLHRLKTHRKNILLTLHRNGELKTSTLREKSKVPPGSKNHHLDLLQDWGLVRMLGRVGGDENGERIFMLTSDGTEFVEEHLKDITPEGMVERLDRLEEQCSRLLRTREELEEENRELRERLEETEELAGRNKEAISTLKKRL